MRSSGGIAKRTKARVCKTLIRGFESHCRLHSHDRNLRQPADGDRLRSRRNCRFAQFCAIPSYRSADGPARNGPASRTAPRRTVGISWAACRPSCSPEPVFNRMLPAGWGVRLPAAAPAGPGGFLTPEGPKAFCRGRQAPERGVLPCLFAEPRRSERAEPAAPLGFPGPGCWWSRRAASACCHGAQARGTGATVTSGAPGGATDYRAVPAATIAPAGAHFPFLPSFPRAWPPAGGRRPWQHANAAARLRRPERA